MKNKKTIYLYIGMIGLLYPGFLISLWSYAYPNSFRYIMPIVSLLFIYLYGKRSSSIALPKKILLIWMPLLAIIFYKNQDMARGIYVYILMYLVLFLSTLCLVYGIDWIDKTVNVMLVFCIVHLLAGFFFLLNKDILLNDIVPMFEIGDNAKNILLQNIENGYMTGFTNHYSTMGMYMSLGVIVSSAFLFNKSEKSKKSEVILFVLMALGVCMTGQRGAVLFSTIAILLVYAIFCAPKTKKQIKKMVLYIIPILIIAFVAYSKIPQIKSLFERFLQDSNELNEISSGRVEYFWINALSMFMNSPILGNGWRSFKYTSISTGSANDAHNIYLQLVAEGGIIGFLILITFLATTWRVTYQSLKNNKNGTYFNPKQDAVLKVSLVYQTYFILYGFTGNPLYELQCYVPYFLFVAIGWAGYYHIRKVNRQKSRK